MKKKTVPRLLDMPLAVYRRLTAWGVNRLLEINRASTEKGSYVPVGGRILYVASSALPYHASGYTMRTHEVLRALQGAGADLRVLTRPGYPWDCPDAISLPGSMETIIDGVVYEHVRHPSNFRPLLLYVAQAAKIVAEVARREKVALIHAATNFLNALPALVAARQLGIPFQYEMRGLWELTRISQRTGYENSEHYLFGLEFEGVVARHADRVFVISDQLGRFAQERWGIPADRFLLLPNCVDPDRIGFTDPQRVEPNTIGYAGALVGYEGLDTLVDAIHTLMQRGIDVRVNIVGDGEAREQLKAQVERLGLMDRIRFWGRVPPQTAREILGGCALVCIPRKPYKVCEIVPPIKLVEAMAMGKPVIVPDLPVFRDELGGRPVGWFFKAGDAIDLARVIQLAFIDGEGLAAAGTKAREYATTKRRWHNFVVEALRTRGMVV